MRTNGCDWILHLSFFTFRFCHPPPIYHGTLSFSNTIMENEEVPADTFPVRCLTALVAVSYTHLRPDTTTPGLEESRQKLIYYNMNKADKLAYDRHLDALMIQNDVLSTCLLYTSTASR